MLLVLNFGRLNMKNFIKLTLFLLCLFYSYFINVDYVYAHPGGTDANGCHTCRTNCEYYGLDYGEYHCHNSSSSLSYNTGSSKTSSSVSKDNNITNNQLFYGAIIIYIIYIQYKNRKREKFTKYNSHIVNLNENYCENKKMEIQNNNNNNTTYKEMSKEKNENKYSANMITEKKVMYCRKCGFKLDEDVVYCRKCGNKVR